MQRVEWTEIRREESFQVIAEVVQEQLVFWEKSQWEIRWYQFIPSAEQLAKAESIIGRASSTSAVRSRHAMAS